MSQRNTYSNSSSRSRTSTRTPAKKNVPQRAAHKRRSGGNIGWVLLILLIVAVGIIGFPYIKDKLAANPTRVNTNASDLTQEEAYVIVSQAVDDTLNSISVVFRYDDKSWEYNANDLQATVDIQSVINKAYENDQNGYAISQYQAGQTATLKQLISSALTFEKINLVTALGDLQSEIDNPMIEPTISFDPSNYDYFLDIATPDVDMSLDMFTITEGQVGYEMDYDDAVTQLNQALSTGLSADIEIKVVEAYPTITVEELEMCRTLLYHSSSEISTANKQNANRNHNIGKAIGHYKGLVLLPGEMVSYNELLGERTIASGWLEAPTITQDKVLEDALGGGICQAATTIFNAAFMGGANTIDHGPHSWAAYYSDFGYGMDAMVNWSSGDDLIFKNDTNYPIFFNTYFWYDKYGLPGYVDVDVYSMPQTDDEGNILHIRPDINIIERTAPEAPTYIEDIENKFADKTWTVDTTLNKMIYVYRNPKDFMKVSVDKVWYKDCVQTAPGVFEGGVEVKREYSHTYTYPSVTAIIYTKPIPVATPTPEPTDASG